MKQFLLICVLLVFCFAARQNTKPDPMEECLKKFCRAQTQKCADTANCVNVVTDCANSLQTNSDFAKYDICLKKNPAAKPFSDCIIKNCLNASASESFAMYLNRMN